ncbi:MAG: efflux RND transporter permease subunit [Chitinispirillaceae bacterium]
MKLLRAFKYPKLSLLIILLITLFFAFHLPRLVINNDVIIFLPENNPHRKAFDNLHEQFGRNDGIIIAATTKQGLVYEKENIQALQEMNQALLAIDSVEDIMSLTNTDYVEGMEGMVQTYPIVETIPESESEELEVRRRLEDWDIYKGTLYTDDFRTSLTLVRLRNNSIRRDEIIYHEVVRITQQFREHFDVKIAGSPAVFVLVGENMNKDLSRLIPFVILVVLVSLWFSFRRPGGVILPMITVIISTIWSLGLMSLLGVEMTMIATVIPVLLVAVGSAYGIHIMAHYYEEVASRTAQGRELSRIEHEQVLESTISGVGKAVMLAALTTMTGFGSLATSGIIPVRDFGIFTCAGVGAAFVIAVALIPSILHFIHSRKGKPAPESKNVLAEILLSRIEGISRHPGAVLTAAVLITITSVIGMTQIRNGNAIVNFFKEKSSVWQANRWLQRNTNGTSTLSIVIRGEESGDLAHPKILTRIEEFSSHMKSLHPNVKKVGSLTDLIKRINAVMHAEEIIADSSISYSEIPSDPEKYGLSDQDELKQLISQYLMLFSGDVDQFADDGIEPRVARVLLQMNTNDVDSLNSIRQSAREWLVKCIPEGYSFEIAGTADAEIEVNQLIIDSQIKSILFSMVVVFLLIALFFRSAVAGLCGMICLALPLLINFGVMGLLGIRLDIATAMVSSVAIGIGIDYMIHYMSAFARELNKSKGDWDGVSTRTTLTCGRAIIFNAVSVALGFAVILFSNFKPLNNLGGMIFLTMATSSLSSLTILPVIFNRFRPAFLLKNRSVNISKDSKEQSTETITQGG